MAIEPSIAATQPAAPASAPNRTGMGGRSGSGEQPLEGMFGGPFAGLADAWRLGNNPNSNQGSLQQWLRGAAAPIVVTPRVSMAAASFPAITSVEAEADAAPKRLTPSDLQAAVGMYEYNMRITSGSQRDQGSHVNRFS